MLWEIKGDLFDPSTYGFYPDAIVITTNGVVLRKPLELSDGSSVECAQLVMGKGCALSAKGLWPWLPGMLGRLVKEKGNVVHLVEDVTVPGSKRAYVYDLLTFPVKHHWKDKADPDLIRKSCVQLVSMAKEMDYRNVVIPRPGCGAGSLQWTDVKPILEEELGHKFHCDFHVITY